VDRNERRRHRRYDSLNFVSYICSDIDGSLLEEGMGRTLNISKGGILLETTASINPRNLLVLGIGLKDEIADIKGEVIYSRNCDGGTIESGIQFLEIEEESLPILERYIEAFREQELRL
jgi:hypothetical protein